MHSRELIEALEQRYLLSSANGLVGSYYDDTSFNTLVMTRNDLNVNFNFGNAGPVPQIGTHYSIEWQGQILPPTSGLYTFYADTTGEVQLTIRGTQVFSRLSDGSGEVSGTIPLSGGQIVDLELDYANDTNTGGVQLSWATTGITKQIIPNSVLYNTNGVDYTFTNPIAPTGADPWVQYENGEYYYAYSNGGALFVAASSTLEGIGTASATEIYSPPSGEPYSNDLWAPELHYLENPSTGTYNWYVYFAADDTAGDNDDHRMYVIQSTGQNPQGLYTMKGEIEATPDTGVPTITSQTAIDHWAIDGTVVTIGANNYFVWSGWDGTDPNGQSNVQQNLYIALMSNPWTISGSRYILSQPTYSWEKNGLAINEGPEELIGNTGKVFVIYSASGYWTNQYCLGQLTYNGTGNPLLQASWAKAGTPVFQSDASVVGVGHASFTTSPDGTQNWIVYHAHNTTGDFTGVRDINIQQFTYNRDGTPNFGTPVAPNTPIEEPSGTPHYTSNFNYPVYPTAPSVVIANTTIVSTPSSSTTALRSGAISVNPILATLTARIPALALPRPAPLSSFSNLASLVASSVFSLNPLEEILLLTDEQSQQRLIPAAALSLGSQGLR